MPSNRPTLDDCHEVSPMIHVTEKAARKIQELLRKENVPDTSGGLRLGVQGG